MTPTRTPECACGLLREVRQWKSAEEGNGELARRVAAALDEVRSFLAERRADLERRKGRVLQSGAYRSETAARDAALAAIEQHLAGGRNITRIFADIDRYLRADGLDDPLSRLHTRTELADARDEFTCAYRDSIRGTRLAALLDLLHFMPFSFWRQRGLEQRNFRSPSAAETLALLEELARRGIDLDGLEPVQLAALVRLQLGITPRMDYHRMTGERLAELLTDGETLTRFTARLMPLQAHDCRAAGTLLADMRRWWAEFFGAAGLRAPAEVEAEMLQIAFLAGGALCIHGPERERAADYLWLLATVTASVHATLKDALAWPAARDARFASVRERLAGARTGLDLTAVLLDGVLVSLWADTKAELGSLTARSESLSAASAHDIGGITQLEQLKERRSEAGKSLIKLADALRLAEPACLDMLAGGEPTGVPAVDGRLRALGPGGLIDRNRALAEETRQTARAELERLRALIARIAVISRRRFAAAPAPDAARGAGATDRSQRRGPGGAELQALPERELEARLLESLRRAASAAQDFRSRIEGGRKRVARSELLQSHNVLGERLRRLAEADQGFPGGATAAGGALKAAEAVCSLLRECLVAHTALSARVGNAKLPPAEKQPLSALLQAMKARLGDDLRDVEGLRVELTARPAGKPDGAADGGAAGSRIAGLVAGANRAHAMVRNRVDPLPAALGAHEAALLGGASPGSL